MAGDARLEYSERIERIRAPSFSGKGSEELHISDADVDF